MRLQRYTFRSWSRPAPGRLRPSDRCSPKRSWFSQPSSSGACCCRSRSCWLFEPLPRLDAACRPDDEPIGLASSNRKGCAPEGAAFPDEQAAGSAVRSRGRVALPLGLRPWGLRHTTRRAQRPVLAADRPHETLPAGGGTVGSCLTVTPQAPSLVSHGESSYMPDWFRENIFPARRRHADALVRAQREKRDPEQAYKDPDRVPSPQAFERYGKPRPRSDGFSSAPQRRPAASRGAWRRLFERVRPSALPRHGAYTSFRPSRYVPRSRRPRSHGARLRRAP